MSISKEGSITSGKLIAKLFRKNMVRYGAGIILVIVTQVLNTQIPKLLGDLIDSLQAPSSVISEVYALAGTMAGVAIAAFLFRFLWRYLIMGFTRSIELNLRESLFTKLQSLSANFYLKYNTGDLITRSISDVQAVRMMFGMGLVGIVDVLVVNAVSIYYMVQSTGWLLTASAIIPIPFIILLLVKVRSGVRKRFRKLQESISAISSKVQENITGIRVVKAFAQEKSESAIFDKLSRNKWGAEMKMARLSAVVSPIVQLAFGTVFSVFLIFGGQAVIKGTLSLGDFVAFNGYLLLVIEPVNMISRIVQVWQRGRVSMSRLDEIFRVSPEVDDSRADSSLTELESTDIRVEGLTYFYPESNKKALQNISFSLPQGGILAIMGPTGSGKTTLANLLMRVWQAPQNHIYIGGHEISTIPLALLRQSIAYVPQDTFLFSDSIENNIRFSNESIPFEEVEKAAIAAAVDDNIKALPKGYETVVGERGMTLSGGQKQRICIARALVKNPRILLLDDCLSAVDSQTEQLILGNLREIMTHCTTLMITHRVSAAAMADKILLLDEEGRMAAFGSHSELKATSPAYQHLLEVIEAEKETESDNGKEISPQTGFHASGRGGFGVEREELL